MKLKFRFTIASKLSLSFGIIMVAVFINSYFTYKTLGLNKEINEKISTVYSPSVSNLNELYYLISETKTLIRIWVFVDTKTNSPDKTRLQQIHSENYSFLNNKLNNLIPKWDLKEQSEYQNISNSIHNLFIEHNEIMDQLNNEKSYSNQKVLNICMEKTRENGAIITATDKILLSLEALRKSREKYTTEANIGLEKSFKHFQNQIILMAFVLFIAILIIGFILTRAMVGPINYIKQIIIKMGNGYLPEESIESRSDEIGEMGKALNVLVKGLRQTSEFALKIGEGDFVSKFKPLGDNDVLGNSLLLMRQNLKNAAEEAELRKTENNQRSWASTGLAEFGEILRKNNDNIEELATAIISKLVRNLDANLGGLFIINDQKKDDIHLELAAFYAYDREKYVKKRIEFGEGIVGQCVQENETMYLTDIPEDYVHISSGLGRDNPKSLLIVPLKLNEVTFGVVELASFKEFEPYQIEFVEKIGETIASTISSLKISLNTSKLLAESHEKSERLAKQEEEMRKNIEEMQQAQNEMQNKFQDEKFSHDRERHDLENTVNQLNKKIDDLQHEAFQQKIRLQNTFNSINNAVGSIELTMREEINTVNSKYLRMAEMTSAELIGRNLREFVPFGKEQVINIEEMHKFIDKGGSYSETHLYYFNDKKKWFYETFSPIKDENGKIYKIMVISYDLTGYIENEIELGHQLQEIKAEIDLLRQA